MSLRDLSRPLRALVLTVKPGEEGLRLDAWLHRRVPWRSRADLQRRIGDGRILLDGRRARKSARVRSGQTVRVRVDEGAATEEVPTARIPLRILWEDRWLVALDKAPGTVVHPVGRHVMDTLINALHVRYRHAGDPACRPMIVHRLDRDTSGVLVLAKEPEARRRLGRAFEERRVEKTYLAVVEGTVARDLGPLTSPIGPDPCSRIRLKVACVPGGRPSRTDVELVSRHGPVSLVRCRPRTGRQHQVRVHLATAGHPILADRLYGRPGPVTAADLQADGSPDEVLLTRQALHAESLAFVHPVTGEDTLIAAPLPADLQRVCARADG